LQQFPQNTPPHSLQWCLRLKVLKVTLQEKQFLLSESGNQAGFSDPKEFAEGN